MSTPAGSSEGLSPSGITSRAAWGASPLARALASRWAILTVFPSLVLALGLFLIWSAQDALRGSNLDLAATRMGDEALLVSEHLGAAFEGADVVLSDLRDFSSSIQAATPLTEVALPLRHMVRGRAGVSYTSISFPDGTFVGGFVDADGIFRFQVSRVLAEHTEERVYDYGPRGTLVLREVRISHYDPRERPFYRLALASREPVWTEPYPFARTGDTGITRTVAVRQGPLLHAVLTIDFDVRRLSPLLVRRDAHAERPILFDEAGTILADPQLGLEARPARAGPTAPHQFPLRRHDSLDDPALSGFFAKLTQRPDARFFSFSTPTGPHLAAMAPLVGTRSPSWRVAFLAPEKTFLASLRAYRRHSFILAGVALLIATLLSTAFARFITRARKEASDAREAERLARREARELGSDRLVQKLGEGGMGEVWRAEHRLLARQAAIKLIKHSDHLSGTLAQERFRREAQCIASLRSRNTIELFDYGVTDEGTFFYVMELLDGLDLETLVQRDGPQPVDRSLQLLIQVCRSLAEAHDSGLVHRDIKPANIFVCRVADELDVVKVLDFGLVHTADPSPTPATPSPTDHGGAAPDATAPGSSRGDPDSPASPAASHARLTRADHVLGTPSFMAPEQASGAPVDHRADLYAIGCLAFWLLAGRTVFSATPALPELAALITEAPPRLEDVVTSPLPPGLSELVDRCLAKSPEQRPQTAHELKESLTTISNTCAGDWSSRVSAWWQQQRPAETAISLSPTLLEDVSSSQTLAAKPVTLAPTRAG